MTYIKDSQGEDVQCEECNMYPAEYEWWDPETDEILSICVGCRRNKDKEDITNA